MNIGVRTKVEPKELRKSPVKHLYRPPSAKLRRRNVLAENSTVANKTKEFRELTAQLDNLSKSYEKLSGKHEKTLEKVKEFTVKNKTIENELGISKSVISKMAEEKTILEQKVEQNKDYIRKLEATITAGPKGQLFTEITEKLKAEIQTSKDQLSNFMKQLNAADNELKSKDKEIINLKEALDIHADNLKIKGDIRGGVLYELGEARVELKKNTIEVTELRKQVYYVHN
jgi:chromosome segregation ATPase